MLNLFFAGSLKMIFHRFRIAAIGIIAFTWTVGLPAAAQQAKPSQAELTKMYQDAKAQGMSDEDIQKAALANGVTMEELVQLQSSLKQGASSEASEHIRETSAVRGAADESPEETTTTKSTATTSETGHVFGASFFSSGSITFEPNLKIPTPLNYVLGPDDELRVDISGNAVATYNLSVSPEGSVNLLNFPPIFLSGLTIEEAKRRIVSTLRTSYAGPGIYFNVTLNKIRSIRVTVTGESSRPGTYTVSSLASVFHALHVSGGPSHNGTYRFIQLIRNHQVVKEIDLYRFLISGDASDNMILQDQDIILIKPYKTRVSLEGSVKRQAQYEVLPSETLGNVIEFAGGFSTDAYTKTIPYRRNTGKEYKVGQIDYDQIATFGLQDGDKFQVGRILDRFENRVSIRGSVFRQGDYALMPGEIETVKQLIQKADGLTENAFLNRAVIYRQTDILEPEVIAFDLRKLISGEIPDIPLRRNDVVEIRAIQELQEERHVSIYGFVLEPGQKSYRQGMTLANLIFEAKGFADAAIPYRIEVSRRVKDDTIGLPPNQNVKIYELNVDSQHNLNGGDREFVLEPYDKVFVRKSPHYEDQRTFTVLGRVKFPGTYTVIKSQDRIDDAVRRAGGLIEDAYLPGSKFFRKGQLVAVDLNRVLEKPGDASNLLLQSGDTLVIPQKLETVQIQGHVLNPSVVNYDASFNYKDYLDQAGGYLPDALRKRVYVTYPNGRVARTKRFLFFKSNPEVLPGSVVTVPAKPESTKETMSRTERIILISSATTITISLLRIIQDLGSKP